MRRGDFIACPPGGSNTAHQFVNTGMDELRFLAISTVISPEICEYPRSGTGKFTVSADVVDAEGKPRRFRYVGNPAGTMDYWKDE